MGSFENEKRPKRAIAIKQSDVMIGFFTALSYILILLKFSVVYSCSYSMTSTSAPSAMCVCPAITTWLPLSIPEMSS